MEEWTDVECDMCFEGVPSVLLLRWGDGEREGERKKRV